MKRGYKYRIYPTKEQKKYFAQCFGANRWWWNYCLNKLEVDYQEYKAMKEKGEDVSKRKKLSAQYNIARELPALKKSKETEFLKVAPAISFIYTAQDVDTAYKDFLFKKDKGKPKFKTRGYGDSFTYQIQKKNIINGKQDGTIIDWKHSTIEIPKIGKCKIVLHRAFNGTIKSATISKQSYDYYEISLLVDDNICELDKKEPTYDGTVGIDLGVHNNAILSDGTKFDTFKSTSKIERKIKRLQKKLSKKVWVETGEEKFSKKYNKMVPVKRPSKNRIKLNEKIAKLRAKEKRCREYNAHQISSYVTKNDAFNTICLEDLNISGMLKNHKTAKSTSNASMYRLKQQIEYKGGWYGKNVVKIDTMAPSTQICNCCGYRNTDLRGYDGLSIRKWTCPQCGAKHDRDINAAKNIKDWGYKKITEGKQ